MTLKNLLLPNRETRNIELLMNVCFWLGIEVTRLDAGEEDRLPPRATLSNTTVHGGPTFCRRVAAALGGYVVEPAPDFLPTLPQKYLSRQVDLTTLGEARSLTEPKFIKPVADKFFPAAVYENGARLSAGSEMDEQCILVSDPVEWEREYRMFVLDNQVQTYSPYFLHEGVHSTEEQNAAALAFSQSVLNDNRVRLPRAVVLDVGWIRGAGLAVVEANEAVMSGIYDCDPIAVLEVLKYGLARTDEANSSEEMTIS
ncbi:MAG: ATP-grasp domain-containing protein [Janthinobacterium lividum]